MIATKVLTLKSAETAAHDSLHTSVLEWHTTTRAILKQLADTAFRMQKELERNPDSPLAAHIDADDLYDVIHTLGEAECAMNNVNLRAGYTLFPQALPDPLKVMEQMSRRKGGR